VVTLIFASFVVLGLVGEFATDSWINISGHLDKNVGDPSQIKIAGELHFTAFVNRMSRYAVIAGVAGEFGFGIWLLVTNRRLAILQGAEIGALELKIAQANLATEELRKENLKLREELSPRRPSEKQLSALRDVALHVREHDMDVLVVGSATETKEFAQLITFPFRTAGWDIRFWSAPPEIINRGISISFWAHANPESRRTAEDVLTAFSLAKIDCEGVGFFESEKRGVPMGSDQQQQQKKMAEIRMIVGEKPHRQPTSDSPALPQ